MSKRIDSIQAMRAARYAAQRTRNTKQQSDAALKHAREAALASFELCTSAQRREALRIARLADQECAEINVKPTTQSTYERVLDAVEDFEDFYQGKRGVFDEWTSKMIMQIMFGIGREALSCTEKGLQVTFWFLEACKEWVRAREKRIVELREKGLLGRIGQAIVDLAQDRDLVGHNDNAWSTVFLDNNELVAYIERAWTAVVRLHHKDFPL